MSKRNVNTGGSYRGERSDGVTTGASEATGLTTGASEATGWYMAP